MEILATETMELGLRYKTSDLITSVIDTEEPYFYQRIHSGNNLEMYESLCRIKIKSECGRLTPIINCFKYLDDNVLKWFDLFTIKNAIKQLASNSQIAFITVNVEPLSLCNPEFVQNLKLAKKEQKELFNKVVIEITERNYDVCENKLVSACEELKQMGFMLALDDFGIGANNLSLLCKLNIDVLKIDGMFVSQLSKGSRSSDIITLILELSKKLKFIVIAECVENEEEYKKLSSIGIRYFQGYYLSLPKPMNQT